ncbi:MAG: hypothetical protein ACRDQZ_19475 [Mycobacteriales bacterium]
MPTKFEYLLNAMENAASQDRPADFDYAGKRRAVLEYAASLEPNGEQITNLIHRVRKLLEWMPHYSVGSSGYMRRLAVEGAIERLGMGLHPVGSDLRDEVATFVESQSFCGTPAERHVLAARIRETTTARIGHEGVVEK